MYCGALTYPSDLPRVWLRFKRWNIWLWNWISIQHIYVFTECCDWFKRGGNTVITGFFMLFQTHMNLAYLFTYFIWNPVFLFVVNFDSELSSFTLIVWTFWENDIGNELDWPNLNVNGWFPQKHYRHINLLKIFFTFIMIGQIRADRKWSGRERRAGLGKILGIQTRDTRSTTVLYVGALPSRLLTSTYTLFFFFFFFFYMHAITKYINSILFYLLFLNIFYFIFQKSDWRQRLSRI